MHPSGREGKASVLVPGITAPSSVTCLRSLNPRGIQTIVGSDSRRTPAAASKYCDMLVELPDPNTDLRGYADRLLEIAARPSMQTIIPVREPDVYALAAHKDEFAEYIATPWPDLSLLRRVQDRVELFAAAETAGVWTPDKDWLDEWDDWNRETIIKPRYTVAAPEYLGPEANGSDIGSTVYYSPGEPPAVEDCLRDWGHLPLVQEYIPDSREYGFFALYDEGEAVATFQHCQHRGYKYCGGPSAYRESTDIPELDAAGRALLDELEWHGLAMVEFLRDPDTGEFKLMEINPRFWSSLPFTVRAGADFPYYYWQLAMDEPIDQPPYEVGIGGHLLRGECCYLHSIVAEDYPLVERPSFGGALRTVAHSLITQPRFDYAVADDFLPFVRDGLNAVQAGIREHVHGDGTGGADDPNLSSAVEGPPTPDRDETDGITVRMDSTDVRQPDQPVHSDD